MPADHIKRVGNEEAESLRRQPRDWKDVSYRMEEEGADDAAGAISTEICRPLWLRLPLPIIAARAEPARTR